MLLALPPAAAAGSEPADPAVRHALLIGINRYQALPQLQGSVNDVETVREILIRRWGFDPRRVELLRDAAASRAGILESLRSLTARAGPEDLVYIHYSGHGSQVVDLNGDEVDDGLDETWVPHDGRTAGVPDITDDELDALLDRFRTRHVVVVIDACHSGTATRSASIRVRAVPPDTRLELYESQGARRSILETSRRRVTLSAARSDQLAFDGPIDGRHHGFFSYALSRSLLQLAPSASARQFFESVVRELGRIKAAVGRQSMPEPQLESWPQAVDAPLLGAATATAPNLMQRLWLAVRVLRSTEVLLEQGALLGAVPGSRWLMVADPPQSGMAPGEPVLATVIGQRDGDAIARLDGSPRLPARNVRAIPLSRPVSEPTVAFLDTPAVDQDRIMAILQRDIRRIEADATAAVPMYIAEPTADGGLRILSGDAGEPIGDFDLQDTDSVARLRRLFVRAERKAALLALDNVAGSTWLAAELTHQPAVREQAGLLSANLAPPTLRIRKPGEPRTRENSLQLRIRIERPAFLTVAAVDALGQVVLVFPTRHQKAGFLPDGWVAEPGVVQLPDSLETGNAAGFHWDVAPPPGTDTLRIFASTDPATTRAIRQYVEMLAGSPGAGPQFRGAVAAGPSPAASLQLWDALSDGAGATASWVALTLILRTVE